MSLQQRKRRERVMLFLMRSGTVLVVLLVLSVILSVFWKGIPALSLDTITRFPEGGFYLGGEGGVLNAIIGSLLLAGGATFLAFAVGLPLALYINIYLPAGSRVAGLVRLSLDVLWGIPSIVYGALGITVMLVIKLPYSLLAGIVVVALIEIPVLTRAIDEVIALVPHELVEAGYSLGAGARDVSFRVIVRRTISGIVTAVLLAFGRGIGDAAAVMLVAGFQDGVPGSLFEPVATLPLTVFYLMNMPLPGVRARGYAAAVVLVAIIVSVSVLSRILGRRFSRRVRGTHD